MLWMFENTLFGCFSEYCSRCSYCIFILSCICLDKSFCSICSSYNQNQFQFFKMIIKKKNSYKKKLNAIAEQRRRVIVIRRNRQKYDIHMSEVMVGDVVMLFEYLKLTNESAMVGETYPIKKDILQHCIAKRNQNDSAKAGYHEVPTPISGTRTLIGEGKMIILVVGDLSCVDKINASQAEPDGNFNLLQYLLLLYKSNQQLFLKIYEIWIIQCNLNDLHLRSHKLNRKTNLFQRQLISLLFVLAIPERLSLALVTLSLDYSIKQMFEKLNSDQKNGSM